LGGGEGGLSIMTAGSTISCEVRFIKETFFATRFRIKERLLSNNFTTQKFISETPLKKMKFIQK